MDSSRETSASDGLWPFALSAALVLCMVVATGLVIAAKIPGWAERGQFGDMFGGINATFSGLAFSALVYTLILQRRELKLQRLELALTRQELQKQAAAQERHADTALLAARVAGLGAQYQGYAALVASGRERDIFAGGQIGPGDWPVEVFRVQSALQAALFELRIHQSGKE